MTTKKNKNTKKTKNNSKPINKDKQKEKEDRILDEQLKETFPASDSPANY